MTPEQEKLINDRLNEFTLQLSEHLAQTVQGTVKVAIKEVVNGKIDRLANSLDIHIEKVEPLMRKFQSYDERFTVGKEFIMVIAKGVAWFGGLVITLGGAYLILREMIRTLLIHFLIK